MGSEQNEEPALTREDRMTLLEEDNAASERVLGLRTIAKADEDIWIVYGALAEEYNRLKGWKGGLQGGHGELATMW